MEGRAREGRGEGLSPETPDRRQSLIKRKSGADKERVLLSFPFFILFSGKKFPTVSALASFSCGGQGMGARLRSGVNCISEAITRKVL